MQRWAGVVLPKESFIKVGNNKISLCFSKQEKQRLSQEKREVFCIEELVEYLEETNSLIEDISENTTKQKTIERVSYIINQERLKKLKEKDEYEEMINAIDDEGIERTKQEEDENSN